MGPMHASPAEDSARPCDFGGWTQVNIRARRLAPRGRRRHMNVGMCFMFTAKGKTLLCESRNSHSRPQDPRPHMPHSADQKTRRDSRLSTRLYRFSHLGDFALRSSSSPRTP